MPSIYSNIPSINSNMHSINSNMPSFNSIPSMNSIVPPVIDPNMSSINSTGLVNGQPNLFSNIPPRDQVVTPSFGTSIHRTTQARPPPYYDGSRLGRGDGMRSG